MLEEGQCEIRASMGFEILEPVIYPPLSPSVVEDLWACYCNAGGEEEEDDDDDDKIEEEDSK
jgi:hypothetical protein